MRGPDAHLKDKSFTYDKNGNLTSMTNSTGTTLYAWDARDKLIAIEGPTTTARFRYDARNRRIEKTINGRTIQYLYDGINIAAEIENGSVTTTYARSLNIDEVFARGDGNGVRYYLHDGLRSTLALADETGAITTSYIYDPFGNVTVSGEPSDNPFRYTGRENDGAGLYYYRARYYNSEAQRFISEDPIGFSGGLNLYRYTGNNPVNWIDPWGLWRWPDSSGVAIHGETINPFTSGGGGIWGLNYQNNELYTYSGSGIGLDIGGGIESVWAWGSGPWTDEFRSVNLGILWFTGSVFWTPGEGGWFGFSFGLSPKSPIPTVAYEVTNYKCYK